MFTVRVKVTSIVQQFVIALYGSTTIECGHNDLMTQKIKHIVSLLPQGYKLPKETEDAHYVDIEVKTSQFGRCKGNGYKAVYRNRPECRTYIVDALQRELSVELKSLFKSMFHNYVFAYVRGQKFIIGSQKEAILDFCDVYHININKIDYDALKKSWQRSFQYSEIKKREFVGKIVPSMSLEKMAV
jgi:hypothetical protein